MISFRSPFRDITPVPAYKEGPFMIKRRGKYYFMWSQGDWVNDSYHVAYATADGPLGPFTPGGNILSNDPAVATGAGHHSVLKLPGTEDAWVICYHRRPLGETNKFHRVVCLDKMEFRADGGIAPVILTNTGVPAHPARA